MDVFGRRKRSEIMAGIRSKDTRPEMAMRSALHRLGYRYVLHDRRLPGRPDLVFRRQKVVVQVRGCFWHCHTCIDGHVPKSRVSYWMPKLERNQRRDRANDRKLRKVGWRVVVVWECQCRNDRLLLRQIRRVTDAIAGEPERKTPLCLP